MIRRQRSVRSAGRQANRATGHVGYKGCTVITMNQTADVADVMGQAGQNKVGIVSRRDRTLQRAADQYVVTDHSHEHRMLDVVIQRVTVADAFKRQSCGGGKEVREYCLRRTEPVAR